MVASGGHVPLLPPLGSGTVICLPNWDGWMTFNFTSFSTAFQLYQNDRKVKMKGCVQWNPVYERKNFRFRESNSGLLER